MEPYLNYLDALAHLPKHRIILHWDFGGGASAATSAANAQVSAYNKAADYEKEMLTQARSDLEPYRTAGSSALSTYGGLLGLSGYTSVDPTSTLESTPGYKFTLGQGTNALSRSAASKGTLFSGGTSQALTSYGQSLADTTYNSYMNRLAGLVNTGQTASSTSGQYSMQAGSTVGSDYIGAGRAQSQGILNAYNARQSTYGGLLNTGLSVLGSVAGGLLGGPAGAGLGYSIGSGVRSLFGGDSGDSGDSWSSTSYE